MTSSNTIHDGTIHASRKRSGGSRRWRHTAGAATAASGAAGEKVSQNRKRE
jgi:hypothetical protein